MQGLASKVASFCKHGNIYKGRMSCNRNVHGHKLHLYLRNLSKVLFLPLSQNKHVM